MTPPPCVFRSSLKWLPNPSNLNCEVGYDSSILVSVTTKISSISLMRDLRASNSLLYLSFCS